MEAIGKISIHFLDESEREGEREIDTNLREKERMERHVTDARMNKIILIYIHYVMLYQSLYCCLKFKKLIVP